MRIATILARHGTEKYANAVRDVRGIFERRMPEVDHHVFVIDNALNRTHREDLAADLTLIGGDNSAWEFSAWDRGLEALGDSFDDYDFIHLATSAFRQLYVAYLDRFDIDMLGLVQGRAAAVGHIDAFNSPVWIEGQSVQSWIRSSFVFLPPLEMRLLGSLVSIRDKTPYFSGDPAAPFRPDAPLSRRYQQNILGWLTGAGTGQGTEWHSRFQLSRETIGFFESKSIAILNEQLLSCRLRAQGCHLVDATWLATRAEWPALGGRELGAIPDWRQQLAQRDEAAMVLE